MMARNTNVPFKGRIQMRKTYHLQIITFGLRRAAGPYSRARKRHMQCSKQSPLFDHLVGAGQKRRRHGEADRFGGFEVDRELVFRRVLHRQVGRFLALQDAVNVASCATMLVDLIRSVGNQATIGGPTGVDRRLAIGAWPRAR